MNPIEQIWRTMKQDLRKRRADIKTLAQYHRAIQEEWDAIPLSKINELVEEMEERVNTLYNRFGDATGY
jgi:transposase